MSHVRGVIENIEKKDFTNDKGTFTDVAITIESICYHAYVKIGLKSPLVDDDNMKGCMVEFLTAVQAEKEYIKLDSFKLVMNTANSIEPKLSPKSDDKKPSGTTLSIEEVRASALMSAANMIGRLTETRLKKEDALKLADEFVEYILKGGK